MTTFFAVVTEMLDRIEKDPRWQPTKLPSDCPRCFVALTPHVTPPGPGESLPKFVEWCPRCSYKAAEWVDPG